jgi:hypothetical protein
MAEALPDATPKIDLEAAKKELQKGPAEANKQNLSSLVDKTFDELKINDIKNLGESVHGTIFLLWKLSERGARAKDWTPNTIDKQDTQESLAHKFQSWILFSDKFADKLAAMKAVIDSNRANLTNQGDAHIQGLLQQFDDLTKTAEWSAQSIRTETSQKVADLTYKMSADDFDKYGLTKLAPETKKQLKSLCDLDGSDSEKFLFLKKLIGKGPQDNIIGERQLYGILWSWEQARPWYMKEVFERIFPGGDMNKPADIKTFQQHLLQKTADVSLLAQAATGKANVSADIATVLNGDDDIYIIDLLRVNKDHVEDIGKKDPNLWKKIYEAALSMGAAVALQVATLGRGYFAVDSHEITADKVKMNPNSRSFLAYTLGDGGQNITAKFRLVAAELQLNVNDNEWRVIKKTVDFVSQLDSAFEKRNNDPNKLDVIIKNASPSAKSVLEQYKSKPELFNDVEALKNALTRDYLIQQIHEAEKEWWNIKGLMAAIDLKGDTFAWLTFQKMKVDVKDGKSSLAETAARETNIGELKWWEKDANGFQERTDGIIKQKLQDGSYKYYFPHGADLWKWFSAETVSHPLGKTEGKNTLYCDVITSDAPLNIATKINVQRDWSILVSYDLTKTPAVKKASEDKTTEVPVESVQNIVPIAPEIQGDPDFQIAQEALEGKDFSELRRKYPKEFTTLQQSIATGVDISQSWKIFETIVSKVNSKDLSTTKLNVQDASDKTKEYFLSLLTNQNAGIVAFRNFGEKWYDKKSFGDVHKLTHTPIIERMYDNNDLSMFVGTEVRNDQLNKNLTFDKKTQKWSPKDANNDEWKQYATYLNEKWDYRRTQVTKLDASKEKKKPEAPIDPMKVTLHWWVLLSQILDFVVLNLGRSLILSMDPKPRSRLWLILWRQKLSMQFLPINVGLLV